MEQLKFPLRMVNKSPFLAELSDVKTRYVQISKKATTSSRWPREISPVYIRSNRTISHKKLLNRIICVKHCWRLQGLLPRGGLWCQPGLSEWLSARNGGHLSGVYLPHMDSAPLQKDAVAVICKYGSIPPIV